MGGGQSKEKEKKITNLQTELAAATTRLNRLSSLAVPSWRTGDRRFYELHERSWESVGHAPSGNGTDPHPTETRLNLGQDGVLNFDNAAPYGDDLVVTVVLMARKSERLHTVALRNADVSDQGADMLAALLRCQPRGGVTQSHPPQCQVSRLLLNDNPRLQAFGVRRILESLLTRPAELLAAGVLDVSGCSVWQGTADDIAAVEQLSESLQRAHPQFRLVLPQKPEAPFVVDGHHVRLSDFVGDSDGFRPLAVGPLWLHREDIKMKNEAKADSLLRFLQELVREQQRLHAHRETPMSMRKPHECGSCFLAPVHHAEIRAKLTVVAVVSVPNGKTYAQIMSEAEQSGIQLPRSVKLQIFMQICAAVAFSHEHQFAMRSLRPDLFMVKLDHGQVACRYLDYCALRPESMRSVKVQLGCRMTFTDPSVRAGAAVSRSMDSYAAAMMVVYAYSFCDVLDDFKGRQYVWLNEQQRPVAEQVPDALAHYRALGMEDDVAAIVVRMTRPDDKRLSCSDAAKEFFGLLQADAKTH